MDQGFGPRTRIRILVEKIRSGCAPTDLLHLPLHLVELGDVFPLLLFDHEQRVLVGQLVRVGLGHA